MGFLPSGNKILVSNEQRKDYKICLYSLISKPTNETFWEYSQTYNIEFHKSLGRRTIKCRIHQQSYFGLSTMNNCVLLGHLVQYVVYFIRINNNSKR